MNSTKFFLVLSLFCRMPAYGMNYNVATSIKNDDTTAHELQKRLEDTYVNNSFISFDYLDEKKDLGTDILESIAQGTKSHKYNTPIGKQINALDALIYNHKANISWCNSLLGRAWRFVTFKGGQKIDGKLPLSLVQEKLFWEIVSQRTGTPKVPTLPQTAQNRILELQPLITKAKQWHLEQIQGKIQEKEIVTYRLPDVQLKLPNTATFPLLPIAGGETVQPSIVQPSTQCRISDDHRDLDIYNASTWHTEQIKSCNAQSFDLSDQYVATYGDHGGKKQLKAYARPKTRYEIDENGTMKKVSHTTEIKTPYWTKTLQHECTALALWQDRSTIAYSVPIYSKNGSIEGSTTIIQEIPAAKSALAKLWAGIKFFGKNIATPWTWGDYFTEGTHTLLLYDRASIKKIVPYCSTKSDNLFLLLNSKGELYKVLCKEGLRIREQKICTDVADIAVDLHTNLVALTKRDDKQIYIADKETIYETEGLESTEYKYTWHEKQDKDIFPQFQCYKGNIFVWHPETKNVPSNQDALDARQVYYPEIIPDKYSNVESIKTGFCSTKSAPVNKKG